MNEIDTLEDYKRNKEMIEKRRDLEALLRADDCCLSVLRNLQGAVLKPCAVCPGYHQSDAPNDLKAEALRGIVRKIIVFYKDTNTLNHYYLMVE